jgi:dTDP-4-amino-4,6-dideoxy-D-galactose acyltransferase
MEFSRKNIFHRYSQFSVDRKISKLKIINLLKKELKTNQIFKYNVNNNEILFYYQYNNWETDFFKINSVTLNYISYDNIDLNIVEQSLTEFIKFLKNEIDATFIITSEIPSEDNDIIQLLNNSKFRTIETRLHYYNNNLNDYSYPRYNIRDAISDDIPNLKKVASFMRNNYDRFHSDWSFDNNIADKYLETYIENSIKGFADVILVPNDLNSDSFLTANLCKKKLE